MASFVVRHCPFSDVTLAICQSVACLSSSARSSWAIFVASQDILFNLALTTRAWYSLICKEASSALATLTCPLSPANTALSSLSLICQSKSRVKQGAIWSSEDKEAFMDALIAHMIFDPATNTYRPGNNGSHEEMEATLIPSSPCPDPRQARDIPSSCPTKLRIYPDSGATICLGGTKHLRHMGISEKNLVPSSKKVRTVGGFSLTCQGWLSIAFKVGGKTTKQALYICRNVQILYFSKDPCINVGILPPCFPRLMISPPSLIDPIRCDAVHSKPRLPEVDLSEKQKTKTNSNYPRTPPFSPTSENVHKLKKWLLERFANTVFNSSGKFPAMSGPPAHIHLKEGSTPKARHNPIPVPYHYKEQVREALWEDVKRGIISPVPIGTPYRLV